MVVICMPKRSRYYRRLRHRARWRPLGKLTEDHLFILAIVTVIHEIELKKLWDIYVVDCELAGKRRLSQRPFLRRLEYLLTHGLVRKGVESVDKKPEDLYPGSRMPGRSLRRVCMKQPVYWL